MELHRKQKGSLGSIKIIEDLIERGFEVFIEFGDNSKVDLIALVEKMTIRIQVKSFTSKNGSVLVPAFKKGPNYKYRYETDDCDLFAVYVLDRGIFFYLKPEQVLSNKNGITIRLEPSKNGQIKNTTTIETLNGVLEKTIEEMKNKQKYKQG